MADKITKEQRSYIMSRIRSKDSKPEVKARKYLFSKGFRYRKNVKKLPGTPDIVLKKYNTVIFVNGCFWHKHDCKIFKWPKSNVDYWKEKINRNVARDKKNIELLKKMGWNVIILWECQLKKKEFNETMEKVILQLTENLKNQKD